MTGVTMSTCRSELTIPPSTGAAIGFMTSDPVAVDQRIGSRPITTVETVMSFGRSRSTAPSIAASRTVSRVSGPCAAFRWSASSRYTTITTAVCTAVPKSAMKPTHTATLMWNSVFHPFATARWWSSQSSRLPPVRAKGPPG